jgi:hypothetical protein
MYIGAVRTWILFTLAKRPFMMIGLNKKLKVDTLEHQNQTHNNIRGSLKGKCQNIDG